MAVSIGGEGFPNVEPGQDLDSTHAERIAMELLADIGIDACTHAVVHRYDGLILLYTDAESGETMGKHFRCALAGFVGVGPRTSAAILALFGFGSKAALYDQLSVGGDTAYRSFTRH